MLVMPQIKLTTNGDIGCKEIQLSATGQSTLGSLVKIQPGKTGGSVIIVQPSEGCKMQLGTVLNTDFN
jgi:hypothetical protein